MWQSTVMVQLEQLPYQPSFTLLAFRLTQIRSTGAALILLTFAFIKGKDQLYARRDELKDLILFGIIGVSAVTSFYFFALKYLFVSVALIIEFTATIWIALYLRFVKKKHISPIMWLGIACAFSGLILVSRCHNLLQLVAIDHLLGVNLQFFLYPHPLPAQLQRHLE